MRLNLYGPATANAHTRVHAQHIQSQLLFPLIVILDGIITLAPCAPFDVFVRVRLQHIIIKLYNFTGIHKYARGDV